MSKTYRKAHFCDNDRGGAKIAKRFANKRIRRTRGDIPEGYAYLKKIYDSWDIHDYKWTYWYKEELKERIEECISDSEKYGSWYIQGTVNVYRRDPSIYRPKLFTRDTIRKMD